MRQLQDVQQQLQGLATEEGKAAVQKFVPGSVKVYGVRMPLINQLAKDLKKEAQPILIEALWNSGAFEEKILAAKLIGKCAKKNPVDCLTMVERFSGTIDDWAVCDTLGMQSLKPIAATHGQQIFALARKLNTAQQPMQRRLSLVLVEVYTKDAARQPEIRLLVQNLENDKDYYVRKAVAWLKRNMK